MTPPVPTNAWLISLIESNHEAAREGHVRLREALVTVARNQQEHREDWQSDHDALTTAQQQLAHLTKDRDSMSALRIVLLSAVISGGFQIALLIISRVWKG